MKHSNSLKPSTLVVSVGGSLVVPNGEIDYAFLKEFKKLLVKHVKRGWKFVIVVGGGGTARHYQNAARQVGKLDREDVDWLGIHSTRLNAHLMRTILREIAHPVILKDPTKAPKRMKKSVLVAAGWKPGWSTDYVATRIAKRLGAKTVINLSNIEYVYTADPRKDEHAERIYEIGWKDFRKIVGNEWDPGMSAPFDPVASRLAHHSGIKVGVMSGKDIKNLNDLLMGRKFKGTVIGV
jgi:uridylate kinase